MTTFPEGLIFFPPPISVDHVKPVASLGNPPSLSHLNLCRLAVGTPRHTTLGTRIDHDANGCASALALPGVVMVVRPRSKKVALSLRPDLHTPRCKRAFSYPRPSSACEIPSVTSHAGLPIA